MPGSPVCWLRVRLLLQHVLVKWQGFALAMAMLLGLCMHSCACVDWLVEGG
jgi:hypothetical protein